MTPKQADRQKSRNRRTGRYKSHIACDLCGRSAGEGHASHPKCNTWGIGVVLHSKCCAALELLPDDVAESILRQTYCAEKPSGERAVHKILDAVTKGRAGCVAMRFSTRGALVGVYKSVEAGLESDPATPWSVVCEEHHTLVCVESRRAADSTARDTTNFCDDCRTTAAGGDVASPV